MRARYKSLPERASRWFACGHAGLLGERQEPKVGTSNTDGEEAEDNPDGVNPLTQQPHAQETQSQCVKILRYLRSREFLLHVGDDFKF